MAELDRFAGLGRMIAGTCEALWSIFFYYWERIEF